jgi:DNA-binding MarR family transcriptional regulator
MATPKKEEKKVKFDFTKPELDYILENANFTEEQERIFKRLTDKKGRQSIVQISMEENISTATVSRIIKKIKKKILRLL